MVKRLTQFGRRAGDRTKQTNATINPSGQLPNNIHIWVVVAAADGGGREGVAGGVGGEGAEQKEGVEGKRDQLED